jgi:MYXO-CTERM domain-containing protein
MLPKIHPAIVTLLAVALLLAVRTAGACQYANCQSDGAVALPGGADLSLPFKQGENVHLLSGYGPNGGSSLHCRASDSVCANDWYALDLNLPDYPNSGKGQPVVAAAAGTVLDAAWGSSGWANYGQRVYIQHDFGDGHKYVTMYAHLDTIAVSTGQSVQKGEQIGTLGQSCQGALSCASFSTPHCHFAVHQDSNFGGSGSGGSYGGHAVIPEPIDGYTGLNQGDDLVSKNGATTTPPPVCDILIGPAETILEEDSACGSPTGGPLDAITGHGGNGFWTTQDVVDPDYSEGLVWQLTFAQAGQFRVSAWVPPLTDPTTGANYKLQHGAGTDKVTVDQSQVSDDWLELGSFDFAAGGNQWVRLGDNFVNAADQGKQVGIDALRFSPDTSGGGGASGTGGSGWSGGTGFGGSTASGGSVGATDHGGTSADEGGCGCRVANGSSRRGLEMFGLIALGVALVRRRRN